MTIEQNIALLKVVAAARTQARRLFEDRLRELRRSDLLFRRRMSKIDLVAQAATSVLMAAMGLALPHGMSGACYGLAAVLWAHMAAVSYRRIRRTDREIVEIDRGPAN